MTGTDHLDPADTATWPDWTQSMIPPPLLGLEGVEHGEPHVPVVMVGDHLPVVRRLTAEQAREAAAALRVRADVIDPDGSGVADEYGPRDAVVTAALRLFSGDLVDVPPGMVWEGGTTARAHAMADHARQYSRREVNGEALADLLDAIVAAGLTTGEAPTWTGDRNL